MKLKIFIINFCLLLFTEPSLFPNGISENKRQINDLEQFLGETVSWSNTSKSNPDGQKAGSFFTNSGKGGIYLWNPVNGIEIISLDEKNNRTPVINDLGSISWTEYTRGSQYSAYIWDNESRKIFFLEIPSNWSKKPYVNAINNNNEILIHPDGIAIINSHTENIQFKNIKKELFEFYQKLYSTSKYLRKTLNKNNFELLYNRHSFIKINNTSQIIGYITLYDPNVLYCDKYLMHDQQITHGFIWNHDGIQDLGADVRPMDINNYGQVIGITKKSHEHPSTPSDVFLWQDGVMIILIKGVFLKTIEFKNAEYIEDIYNLNNYILSGL